MGEYLPFIILIGAALALTLGAVVARYLGRRSMLDKSESVELGPALRDLLRRAAEDCRAGAVLAALAAAIALLCPWAAAFWELQPADRSSLVAGLGLIAILLLAVVYVWRKGRVTSQ